jgi:hypothetical protein
MRPPDCYVCHLTLSDVPDDSRDYFTLVRFSATEGAKMAPSRAMEAVGRTGHPRNARVLTCRRLPERVCPMADPLSLIRGDHAAGAFQLQDEAGSNEVRVSVPPGTDERILRAAQFYREALAAGSRSPAADTAKAMHLSREHTAR